MKIDRMRVFMTRDKDRPRVIVALDTDDGLTGWGECYNHGPDLALPPLLDYLYGFLAGQDPTRVEYLYNLMIQQCRFPPGALGLAAISGLDHCLWDLAAKAAGVPVYKLLGGEVRPGQGLCRGLYRARRARRARRVGSPE
jgi:galactonate dehydratase